MTAQPKHSSSTPDRALQILLLFNEQRPVLTAHEVTAALGLSRSTVYRYLQRLGDLGLVDRGDGATTFRIGPRILDLARVARKGADLSEIDSIALPIMRRLAADAGETVLLCRRIGGHVVCLERVESPRPIRITYERGQVLATHADASAKVLLAWADNRDIDSLLLAGNLQRFTDATLVDPVRLRQDLTATREAGYAISRGEKDEGVLGVAAPVQGADGAVVASVGIAALEFRVELSKIDDFVQLVCAAAAEIGTCLEPETFAQIHRREELAKAMSPRQRQAPHELVGSVGGTVDPVGSPVRRRIRDT